MKKTPRPSPDVVMTLRLWQEPLDAERTEWRGEIKNLSTGEIRYFRLWEEIADTVHTMLSHRRLSPHAIDSKGEK